MTHLYIEQNTGQTEEVNSSIISKLYELASSGDLDNTSDLKGRLHSTTAKEMHVTYLNSSFDDLYISVDTQYLTFEDSNIETLMKRYIGTNDGVSLQDVQTFILSNTSFGNSYVNTHTNRNGLFTTNNEEKRNIQSFKEFATLFSGIRQINQNTFSAGRNMTDITIPASVTEIGESCFNGCNSLTVTMLGTTPPTVGTNTFNGVQAIKVPQGTLSSYQTAWTDYANKISESS